MQIERERERGVNVPFRFANMVGCTAHFAKKKKEKKLLAAACVLLVLYMLCEEGGYIRPGDYNKVTRYLPTYLE